jgi:biopolymer transport protein TolR
MPKLEPIPSAPSRGGSRRARAVRVSTSLAEINVVPLVDVMLVLLVIFMVSAPMMHQGFPVNLPEARRAQPLKSEPVTVTVPLSFRQNSKVYVGDALVPLSLLAERVKQELSGRLNSGVLLAGDGKVTLDEVMAVLSTLKEANVEDVGMLSQPARGRPR